MYPQTLRTDWPKTYLPRFFLAALAYGLVFWLSLYLVPAGGSGASLVWPPAAVGLAILFFWGMELWPALVAAIFCVLLARGIAPPLAATTALANALEAIIGCYLLVRFVGFVPMFSRLRDSFGLVVVAFASTIVSATLITLGVMLFSSTHAFNSALWSGLWLGHAVSLLSFGPFVLRWLYRPLFTKAPRELLEGVAIFGSIFVVNVLLYWTPYSAIGGISLVYIAILPLVWAALRAGPRGTSLALFMMAIIGATGVLFGFGPIAHAANLSQALLGIQMIIGTLSLIFMLFTSITEERKDAVIRLEEHVGKLEVALDKISSEDQAKTDFIAMLAHELRNPLSPILSGLELLKARETQPADVLHMMGAHLHTTARLLDDLLDISRITQKKLKLQKEPVEIHALVAHTLEMVKPVLEERRHNLVCTLPEDEIWLNGDPVRLSQIFVNLLNNAAKYTDPGGVIRLEAEREGGELLVRVTDNGLGIARERLNKVFEPFGGAEGNTHSRGGLRIGLSLAKRMVDMHHGTIHADSEGLGKGSRFTVRIPLPASAPLPLPSQPTHIRGRFSKEVSKETARRTGALKILIVDDNKPAAESLAALLEISGHETVIALDAPPALESLESSVPHVALLDIGLPTGDGYQLAQRIRERFGDSIKLIALTGYGQASDKQKAKDAGFDEHLVKPVSIADVERILVELSVR